MHELVVYHNVDGKGSRIDFLGRFESYEDAAADAVKCARFVFGVSVDPKNVFGNTFIVPGKGYISFDLIGAGPICTN